MKTPFSILSAALFCTLAFLIPARAANFSVSSTADNGTGTLRDALIQANATADADTISFALPAGAQTIVLTSGELPISKPVTIQGPGAGDLTINGNNSTNLFSTNNVNVAMDGLTLSAGSNSNGVAGVLYNNGTLSISNCIVSNNSVGNAGGAFYNTGTLNISNSTFSGNSANGAGGAIFNDRGTLMLSGSTFSGNKSRGASAGFGSGGAVYSDGSATITGCTFGGNASNSSGGAIVNSGSMSLSGCTLNGNTSGLGGAIFNPGNASAATSLALVNCTLNGNTAGNGGAIVNNFNVSLNSCTLANNSATEGSGGAIYTIIGRTGNTSIVNCTLAGNSATSTGGGFGSSGPATVSSCTFANNSAPSGSAINLSIRSPLSIDNTILSSGAPSTGTNNLVSSDGNIITDGGFNLSSDNASALLNKPTDKNSTSAGLDPAGLKLNGGLTPTIALVAGSAAIDAGNSLSSDQRGVARPIDLAGAPNTPGGNGSDIGSFEFQDLAQSGPNFVVNTTGDTDDDVCGVGDCSLREAINAANSNAEVSAITFDATAFASKQTITLGGGLPTINTNLFVIGPTTAGAGVTVANSGNSNSFSVSGATVALSDLSLTNAAGAIAAVGGTTIVARCTFVGNSFGIVNQNAVVSAQNCTFVSNREAAILNQGGTITVQNCTASGNAVGIRSDAGTTNVNNSIVTGNAVKDITGAITDQGLNIIGGSAASAGLDPNGLRDNGGPTPTIALVGGSPAINAGNSPLSTDGRGVARDSKPDIGAFEFVNAAPQVVSVSPQNATDKVGAKRTFTLSASDPNGAGDISEMWLLINEQLDYSSGATLLYFPKSGLLYLRSGDTFLAGIHIGSAAGAGEVLDNGAVRVVGREVTLSASPDGKTLSLSVPCLIRNGLVGTNTLFGRVVDAMGATSSGLAGEFGFVRSGTYIVQPQFAGTTNLAPTLSKLTPGATNTRLLASGIASVAQNFVFSVKDEDGTGDIESVWFLAGPKRDWAHSATFVFVPRTRRLYLRSDDGRTFLGGARIGTVGILENSQVRLDLSKVGLLLYADGKTLGLRLPLQAKSGLLGQNKVWLRVQDRSGLNSPGSDDQGFILSGTWNVLPTATSEASRTKPSGGSS